MNFTHLIQAASIACSVVADFSVKAKVSSWLRQRLLRAFVRRGLLAENVAQAITFLPFSRFGPPPPERASAGGSVPHVLLRASANMENDAVRNQHLLDGRPKAE